LQDNTCVLVYSLQLLDIVLLYPIGLPEKDCLFIHKSLHLTGETTYQTVVISYSNGKSQGSEKSVRTHERNLLVHGEENGGRREGTQLIKGNCLGVKHGGSRKGTHKGICLGVKYGGSRKGTHKGICLVVKYGGRREKTHKKNL
jgi:hypothetical protein